MKTAIFSTLVLLIFSLIIYVFRLNQSGVDVTANSINGLVTPLISLLTAILLYKSFQAQTQFNKTQTASEEVKNDRDIIHKLITILENNIEYFSYTAQKGNVATKGMEGMKNRFKDWISDYSEQASNINYEQYNLAYSITDSKIYSIIRTSELIVDKILILQRKSMIDSEYSTLIFLFTYEMQIKPLIDELNKYGSIAKHSELNFGPIY
ncbi:MAG: hypothetical protein IPI65_16850 [Bacteroidetes bacterium]|nr:hypothetical protein [Bacteroidota bacterium]